jgi:hypothetical protein
MLGVVYARPSVAYRSGERIDVVAAAPVRRVVRRDVRIRLSLQVPKQLKGPLPRHAVVGTATVRANGRELARVKLVTARAVPEVSLLARAGQAIATPGSLIAIVAMLGGAAILFTRRRAGRRRERRRTEMEAA